MDKHEGFFRALDELGRDLDSPSFEPDRQRSGWVDRAYDVERLAERVRGEVLETQRLLGPHDEAVAEQLSLLTPAE